MIVAPISLRGDYWDTFELQPEDIEFLYNYLLETETPLTSQELLTALVDERVKIKKIEIERERSSGGAQYAPKDLYQEGQSLVFPALAWRNGKVISIRPGLNQDIGEFQVIKVSFENDEVKEFASGLIEHKLNQPPEMVEQEDNLNPTYILNTYGDLMVERLNSGLQGNVDFVRIAGKWFPRALLSDINVGHLNLAEAVLDMAGGGPLPTLALLDQIGLPAQSNSKLAEFSLDLALQEDPRFDEVGPAGEILWYLHRLEPDGVLQVPLPLRYPAIDFNHSLLTEAMLALEQSLDDELSNLPGKPQTTDEVQVQLIYPHWKAGTLPLSNRLKHLFPTAYEAPRIRFMLVDGDSGKQFPGWVEREHRYVLGLREWYQAHGLTPGNIIRVKKGKKAGEVIVQSASRSSREWVQTVLVGSDGGIVFAMLKQKVNGTYDERMTFAISDPEALDRSWEKMQKERTTFEKLVENTARDLIKLNPQGHVHASTLYAAVNILRRCPPGPILSLLAAKSSFVHVGDLHFRYNETERA